ncbi:hypothetical protein CRG98_022820 [Punica granatum]|uniref:non-specific serine/threonine protein kinase n=1 Tax=Punica granatum TaxID=22663 RepID=A0A2I0JKH0_PUNGR|nr:hypothetical protein CRG98_022820 [Punica granatum]
MGSQLSSSSSSTLLLSLISAFLILLEIPPSHSNELYSSCSNLFSCGSIKDVGYPFWGGIRASGCGYPDLELSCENNTTAKIVIASVDYQVLGVYPETQVLKISRQDYANGLCPSKFTNTTLDPALLDLAPGYINFTMVYGCPPNGVLNIPGKFTCNINGIASNDGYTLLGNHGAGICFSSVVVPVSQALLTDIGNSSNSLPKVLQEGFEVSLKADYAACEDCTSSNGVCGYDSSVNQTTCYCADQSSGSRTCSPSSAAGPQGQSKDQGPKCSVGCPLEFQIASSQKPGQRILLQIASIA